MNVTTKIVLSTVLWVCTAPLSLGQLTMQMVHSVYYIKCANEAGTAFTLLYQGKQYLVTAAHVVACLPSGGGRLQITEHAVWKDLHVGRVTMKSKNADIAILIPERPLIHSESLEAFEGSWNFAAGVYFLGFPLGLHMIFEGEYVPAIKHGFVSMEDDDDPDAVITYIDGFNNEGFSGGPVLTQDKSGNWKVISVVSGYVQDKAKQRVGTQNVDTSLLVNSGIIITYNIGMVTQAIDAVAAK